MKKPLLIFGLGALICTASADAAPRKVFNVAPEKLVEAQKKANKINRRNADNKEIWRPGTLSYFNFYEGEWVGSQSYTCTYFPNGLIHEEIAENGNVTSYEYDDLDRLICESSYHMEGDTKVVDYSRTLTYDSVIKDFVVKTEETYGDYGGYTYGIDITRNDAGNVVAVENISEYGGNFVTVEYDDNNVASKITVGYKGIDWVTKEPYTDIDRVVTDIVWEETDGQITGINLGEVNFYEPENNLCYSSNKIKSCTVTGNEWPEPAAFTAEYDGLNYHTLLKFAGEIEGLEDNRIREVKYTAIDNNGSYKASEFDTDFDEDEDGNFYLDGTSMAEFSHMVDDYGLVTEDLEAYIYDDEEEASGYKAEVVYDDTYGYPLEYTINYLVYGEYQPYEKTVYSDYTNVAEGTGVNTITGSSDSAVEFYNLNGVRVNNPSNGLYIRRQGNDVSKVIIK